MIKRKVRGEKEGLKKTKNKKNEKGGRWVEIRKEKRRKQLIKIKKIEDEEVCKEGGFKIYKKKKKGKGLKVYREKMKT